MNRHTPRGRQTLRWRRRLMRGHRVPSDKQGGSVRVTAHGRIKFKSACPKNVCAVLSGEPRKPNDKIVWVFQPALQHYPQSRGH